MIGSTAFVTGSEEGVIGSGEALTFFRIGSGELGEFLSSIVAGEKN